MLSGYWHFLPEVLVVAAALAALFGEYLPGKDRGTAYLGAVVAALAALLVAFGGTAAPMVFGQVEPDGIARFARTGVAGLTAVWLLWVAGRGMPGERRREAVALALFAASGGMLLSMAEDLIVMYIALELSTMPAYVLMGYRRSDVPGLEGSLKYFLLSMLTSIVMLYGLSFVYGISGTTAFSGIDLSAGGILGVIAVLLVLVGLLAKMSAAPFHYWAPDAYAGGAPVAVAFVSTVPKIAGIAVMTRLFGAIAPGVPALPLVLASAAALSMVLGNLAALPQSDIRRLMAYSGVAHTGYLLMALAAGTSMGYIATVFYAVAYAVPSMAVMLVAAEEGVELSDLAGLARTRPWVAWSMLVWLLSLIGIPPLAGFFGKLYLFGAALDAAMVWLVVLGVVTSVISAGYYFRVVREMFLAEPGAGVADAADGAVVTARSRSAATALVLCAVATIAIGLAASPLLASLGVRL